MSEGDANLAGSAGQPEIPRGIHVNVPLMGKLNGKGIWPRIAKSSEEFGTTMI